MDEKNPRAVYDEYGRLMSVQPSGPKQTSSEMCTLVNVLAVSFAVLGVICVIGGISLASAHYNFDWMLFFGGILSAMFSFGWAVVMRVCALYMMEHNK